MKIIGAEGLDPQTIRDEVARGARFVIYHYCVSIVVMTFKRPSNIYFIRPGGNRIVKGLPFDLISLVLGWWGFPWGPIYTIETLVNNLLGGKDVTGEITASLAPAAPAPSPGVEPAMPLTGAPATDRHGPSRGTKIAVGAAVVAALAGTIVCSICYYRSTQLPVVLISGAPQSYTVEIDGVRHQLARGRPVVLTRSEGDLVVTCSLPGSAPAPKSFHFALPFFSHLSESRVAVINPDLAAVFYEETTFYYPHGTTPQADDHADFQVYADSMSYFLPSPDYVFTDFPRQIQMSEGASRTTRTRLAQLTDATPDQQAALLLSKLGYSAMALHLGHLAIQQPEDEDLLRSASTRLTPKDCRAWFERHLGDRPVLVEWHRYYQQFAENRFPDLDLGKQYRGFLATESDNGALRYLLGRVCGSAGEMRLLNEQAIAAPKPCFYGYYGQGVSALDSGDFARARECFDTAAQKGIKSGALQYNQRQARLATGDFEGLLAAAVTRRKAAPHDLSAAEEEIHCTLLAGRGKAAAEKVKTDFLARVTHAPQTESKDLEEYAAYLSAIIAYGTHDAPAFAREITKLKTPVFDFQAAVSLGDHAVAAEALKKVPDAASTAHLLCYLLARLKGDDRAASAYFAQALETMTKEDHDERQLASLLRQSEPPATGDIGALLPSPADKRIVMAALACRYPQNRAVYLDWVRRMNFDPVFPRLLIDQVIGSQGRHA